MTYTQAEIIQAVYQGLPYSAGCTDIDITSEPNALRFTWRGTRFRVSSTCLVEEVENGMLCSNSLSILARQLIEQQLVHNAMLKARKP
jgi:hypothetical protein